ncbi:hypothetical protein ABZY20_05420 [Streptomyces sp. NPDC006624]|uniref:hypothetical protein n=1 Tax=Streptomyces sp. NPDC006624 TaxID=3154892 RepID=UPI0033BD84E3
MEVPGAGYAVLTLLVLLFGVPAWRYARPGGHGDGRVPGRPVPGAPGAGPGGGLRDGRAPPALVAGCGTAAPGFAILLYVEISGGSR